MFYINTVDGSLLKVEEHVKNPFKKNSELLDFVSSILSSAYSIGVALVPDANLAPLWVSSSLGNMGARILQKWEEDQEEKEKQ